MNKKWNIIPIKRNNKLPALKKGHPYLHEQYPKNLIKGWNENMAVVCGKTSNNLVIIDLDYRDDNKQYYRKIFSKYMEKYPKLAKTYIEESPNGHHLFYYIKGDKCPKRKKYQDTSTKNIIKTWKKTINTNFPYLLKGVDILGENGYCLISPSEIDGKKYKAINNYPILSIPYTTFSKIKHFFIKKEPEISWIREPFQAILKGEIDIEDQSNATGKIEWSYWKFLYIELYNQLQLKPQEVFDIVKESQTAFRLDETVRQLGYIDISSKPLRNNTLWEYFPDYKKSKKKKKGRANSDEEPLWLTIAKKLKEEFNIITMEDSEQLMIKRGNIYTFNVKDFYNRLAELIESNATTGYKYVKGSIVGYIKDTTLYNRRNFCYEKWVINFKNGYFDIKNRTFYPLNHYEDKIFCYEIPHNYEHGKYECVRFKKCLTEWIGKDSPITTDDIFEMMGYTMTMNTNMKKAFFIFGDKNTGKTTYQTILEYIIGHDNRAAISLQRLSKNEFGTHGLQFKILDMVGDMGSLAIGDTSRFKVVSGGDNYVEAEIKNGPQYKFKNIVKIWYNANTIPMIDDDDDAFYSRWILIPFPNVFPLESKDTITNLAEIVCDDEDEIQGIIHECLKGVIRLQKRGYFRPEIVRESRHLWKYNAEPLYAFLYDFCVRKEGEKIKASEFYRKFNSYLYKKGKRPSGYKKINDMLGKYNIFSIRETKGDRISVYINVKWKEEGELDKYA